MFDKMKNISYVEGDQVGVYGISFIKEVMPYVNPKTNVQSKKALFKCGKCGNLFTALLSNVKKGNTMSCGCYFTQLHIKHGLYGTRTYRIWNAMIQRCENEENPGYENYGGRGISVFPEWRNDFQLFHSYISTLPNYNIKGYIIDRINNDGNYEPGNVRWSTYRTSNLNKRIPKHNTSGFIGVSFCKKDNAFVAHITVNKKVIYIKESKNPEIAAKARDQYIKDNHLSEHKLNYE
jgi:hypothetical protein